MRFLLISLFIGVFCTPSLAQDTLLLYFDNQVELVGDSTAKLVGIAVRQDSNWTVSVFDKESMKPVATRFYNYHFTERIGFLETYHPNGIIQTKGYFFKNLRAGVWRRWNEKGLLTDSSFYTNGKEDATATFIYHPNGQLAVYKFEREGTWELHQKYFDEAGNLTGEINNVGLKGRQISYQNGKKVLERHTDQTGSVIKEVHFKEDGTAFRSREWELVVARRSPEFPGGHDRLLDYLKMRTSDNDEWTPVKVSFFLNEKGRPVDINIEGVRGAMQQQQVLAYLERMPSWKMKGIKRAGPFVYTITVVGL